MIWQNVWSTKLSFEWRKIELITLLFNVIPLINQKGQIYIDILRSKNRIRPVMLSNLQHYLILENCVGRSRSLQIPSNIRLTSRADLRLLKQCSAVSRIPKSSPLRYDELEQLRERSVKERHLKRSWTLVNVKNVWLVNWLVDILETLIHDKRWSKDSEISRDFHCMPAIHTTG